MSIARTHATGAKGMLPDLLAWSSSLSLDHALVREDLLGSAAHITMLARAGLVPPSDAEILRATLLEMLRAAETGALRLPEGEEDIHMAVEAELSRTLGAVAGRLHTARSRNDQIALDLHLFVRGQAAETLHSLAVLIHQLATRAAKEQHVLLPAYTHRQRAQPISAGFLLCAWGEQLVRAGETVRFALSENDVLPLGSCACSGSSLPIDRGLVAHLLGFSQVSHNALDTVGDRDFALNWVWAACRVLLALGKLSADLIDYASAEFGLVRLDDEISAGSSMMPQKKNPDLFELVRGKTARGIGNVTALLTLVKGLPSGYNRDQQEDRATLLETGPLVLGALHAVTHALPHVHFDASQGLAALNPGFTQATDLAEALVRRGIPFREAYQAVGKLVQHAVTAGVPLASLEISTAQGVHPAFDAQTLEALEPAQAVAAKESLGGTGPHALKRQQEGLHAAAERFTEAASATPSLPSLAARIATTPLQSLSSKE